MSDRNRNPGGNSGGQPFDPYQWDGARGQGQQRPNDMYSYDGSRDSSSNAWNRENPYMNPERCVPGDYRFGGTSSDGRNIYITINCRNAYFGEGGGNNNGYDYRRSGNQYDYRQFDPNYQRMQDYQRACYVPPYDPRAQWYAEQARDQLYRDWVNYQRATNYIPGYGNSSYDYGGNNSGWDGGGCYGQGGYRQQRVPQYYGRQWDYEPQYQEVYGGRRGFNVTVAGGDRYGRGGSGMDPNNPLNWLQLGLAGTTAIMSARNGRGGWG